jgi:hypothetical protein
MNEEFEKRWERQVHFFLQQHAKSDERMERLEVAQAETQKKLDRIVETISSLTAVTFEGFKVLSESHRLTEEELRKLATRMDRHRSEDHGFEN